MIGYFRFLLASAVGLFGLFLSAEAYAADIRGTLATCQYFLTAPFSSAENNYEELKQIVATEAKLPYFDFLRAVEAGGSIWGGELSETFWHHYTDDDRFASELRSSSRFPISREIRWSDLDNLDRYLERHRGEHMGSLRSSLTFDLRASWVGRSKVSEGATEEELRVFAGVNTILRRGDRVRGVGVDLKIDHLSRHGESFDVYSLNGKNSGSQLWLPQDLQRMSLLASEQYRSMMLIPVEARVRVEPVYGNRGNILALIVAKTDASLTAGEFLYRVRRNHLREYEMKQYYDLKEFIAKYALDRLKKELNVEEIQLNRLADIASQSAVFTRIAYDRTTQRWLYVR